MKAKKAATCVMKGIEYTVERYDGKCNICSNCSHCSNNGYDIRLKDSYAFTILK